ncbi:MAG: AAA family ATPase [Deltaproteobacteria bacterium]|jgi:Bacterial TniB protein|nr:MAG: AAA family ATPase [Deltaproteobacteria bacterium]
MTEVDHLSKAAQAALLLPDDQRIERISGARWIGYTRAQDILTKLDDLLAYPHQPRMPNLLLYGATGNGKTMIINRFIRRHPTSDNPGGDAVVVPVLAVQAPPLPSESRLYDAILEALFAPYKARENVSKKQFQVLRLLRAVNTRMLVIDEIHHILVGPTNQQRIVMNAVKYLSNDLQIPLVGVGTLEAVRAIQADPQLASRFHRAELALWRMGREYRKLLASFERMLPLKRPSKLAREPVATKLLAMTEGTIGELSTLLKTAAIYAVRTGVERIDEPVLAGLEWAPPSARHTPSFGHV